MAMINEPNWIKIPYRRCGRRKPISNLTMYKHIGKPLAFVLPFPILHELLYVLKRARGISVPLSGPA